MVTIITVDSEAFIFLSIGSVMDFCAIMIVFLIILDVFVRLLDSKTFSFVTIYRVQIFYAIDGV